MFVDVAGALGRRAWKVRGASGCPVIAAFAAAQTVRGFLGHAKSPTTSFRFAASLVAARPATGCLAGAAATLRGALRRGRGRRYSRRFGLPRGRGRRGAAPCAFFVLGHQRRDGFVLGRRARCGHEVLPMRIASLQLLWSSHAAAHFLERRAMHAIFSCTGFLRAKR